MNMKERLELIQSTKGKTFSVQFTKKDGSIRDMNCRLGVTKHLRGGDSTTAHIPELVTVYDMQSKGYRNINLSTLKKVKFQGKEIDV